MKGRYWAVLSASLAVFVFALVIPVHKTKVAGAAAKPAIPRIIQPATPSPFEISSSECEDKENGFHACTATVAFKSGEKQYSAVSVAFLLTTEDGARNAGALATSDANQVNQVFHAGEQIVLHAPVFQISNDTKQALRIVDIAVEPDSAVDTEGKVWGNKASVAVKEFLFRRAGFTQEEIMKSMGLHGGAH